MDEIYAYHWRYLRRGKRLRFAIIASVALHLSVFAAIGLRWQKPRPKPLSVSYEVQMIAPMVPDPTPEVKPVKAPPPPPKKEEPKKEPEKKPEPKKEEPKKEEPKPVPKKVAEKKPEPKKVEKKPEPKPKPKPEPKPAPKKELPQPEVVAKAPPAQTGVQRAQLPPMLNAWGRQVQRKVEKYWAIPGGVTLTEDNREVHISFWVGRDGMLLSQPVVVKAAVDPALAASGIQAVINAQPLPPLPIEYAGDRQEVIYVFSLMETAPAAGGTL